MLFADMAQYTATAEKLGEEATYTLMHQLIEQISEVLHVHEGTVQNLTGDGVMALFGAPVAIEDGPLKACRAALEIQRRLRSLEGQIQARYDVLPKFRIGIHTGPVIVGNVGDNQRAEITALGDTVNLAARLESEAEPGGILLSDTTHRLAEGFIAATFAGERKVKGKTEAQRVFSLEGLNEAVTRFDVSVERGLTALAGRTDELAALERAWADVKAGGFCMVDLIGEAGIGKSRLVHDFLQRLDDKVLFLRGRCLSSGNTTPFLPFIEVIRSSFHISDGAPRSEAERRLERGLETLGVPVEETLPYLLNLLGYEVATEIIKTVDAEAIGVRTRQALITLLKERRRVSRVVLFIDDLHWMDNASEELLGRICGENKDLPLLLICAYRPGYAAPWRSREGVQEFHLNHLSPSSTEEMLQSRLQSDEIPKDLSRLVYERSQGNPLFAEEIIGYLIERGAVSTTESGVIYLSEHIGTLPVNLENLLMDRFDRLAKGPRRVLETAAVIGTSFQPGLIEAIAGEDAAVTDALSILESQGLVLPDENIKGGLRFKHILVREAIYESLLAPRREALHGRIGAAIERTGGADSVDILAHHYSRANNPAKAVHFLAAAGEKSLVVYSLEEANARFREAIQRIEDNPGCVEDALLVDILLRLARILYFRIEFYDIIAMVERYMPVVEHLGDEKRLARFLFETGYAHVFCARGDIGRSMLERALAIGEKLGDDEAIGYASLGLMWHYMFWCPATPDNRQTALDMSEVAFASGLRIDDVWLSSKALLGATLFFSVIGRPDEGRRRALRLMGYGRDTNDPRPRAMALWSMAWVESLYFNHAEAIVNADEAIAVGLSPIDHGAALVSKAMALIMMGRAEEGAAILRPVRQTMWDGGLLLPLAAMEGPYGLAMIIAGNIVGGVKWIEEGGRRLESWGFRAGPAFADLYLGKVYLEMAVGDHKPSGAVMRRNLWFLLRTIPFVASKAQRHLEDAERYFRAYDMPALLSWTLTDLGRLHAAKKRNERARACLDEARSLAESVEQPVLVERIDKLIESLSAA